MSAPVCLLTGPLIQPLTFRRFIQDADPVLIPHELLPLLFLAPLSPQVHIMLGGHWFYDSADYDIAGIGANYSMITSSFLLSSKYLWRQGFVRCPEKCSEDTPMDKCVCSCPSEIIGDMSAQEVLNQSGIFDLTSDFANLDILGLMDLDYDGLLDMLCHVGHPGEMFTSAAPYVGVEEHGFPASERICHSPALSTGFHLSLALSKHPPQKNIYKLNVLLASLQV